MIATEVSSIAYSGNNSITTAYPVPFPFLDDSHISVSFTDSDGLVTALVYLTDYTVTNNKDSEGRIKTGNVKTIIAYDNTNTITIKRNTPALQSTDFVAGGTLDPESLESSLDKLTKLVQEALRDTSHDGESNVTAAGNGLIAQTAADIFAARTLSPAANSGLSIVNGDGVAGNPTVDLDETGISVVTAVADGALVRVESSGSEVITVANLLARNADRYKYEEIDVPRFLVDGGASGITIDAGFLKLTGTATGGVSAPFTVPEDYSTGDISLKLHAYLFGGTPGDPFVMEAYIYDDSGSVLSLISSAQDEVILHSDTDRRTGIFNLGSSLVAGTQYKITLVRDSAHASDTSSETAYIKSVRVEYQAGRVTTSWA